MAKFIKSGKNETPGINTSSLPDIVFMILMFFMVSTSMRKGDVMVQISLPAATEVAKLDRKDLASYIYIGSPTLPNQALYGTDSRIQLNDSFKTVNDIRDFIAADRESKNESDRSFMTTVIKADKNSRMGVITDVKQELRKVSALRIMYVSREAQK